MITMQGQNDNRFQDLRCEIEQEGALQIGSELEFSLLPSPLPSLYPHNIFCLPLSFSLSPFLSFVHFVQYFSQWLWKTITRAERRWCNINLDRYWSPPTYVVSPQSKRQVQQNIRDYVRRRMRNYGAVSQIKCASELKRSMERHWNGFRIHFI